MAQAPSMGSGDYSECARHLERLHRLIRDGRGDSAHADEIRDALDDLRIRLNAEERDRIGSLPAELNSRGLTAVAEGEDLERFTGGRG